MDSYTDKRVFGVGLSIDEGGEKELVSCREAEKEREQGREAAQ